MQWGAARRAGQIILLGADRRDRLNGRMELLPVMLDSLAAYPSWFVVACVTVVLAVGIWALVKVVKWMLYALLALVLIGGLGMVVWQLVQ